MIRTEPSAGSKPAPKPGSSKYNLNTNEGKTAYLKDVNSEIQKLLNTKYAVFKDKANYPDFEKKVMAAIKRNEDEMKNPENITLRGYVPPIDAANITLNNAASSTNLLSLREKVDDAFGKLR